MKGSKGLAVGLLVGAGVFAASILLSTWFLPERSNADRIFAQEFSWLKEEGVDAIVESGEDLPDFKMLQKLETLEKGSE